MDNVIEMAQRLGKAVAASPQAAALRTARKAFQQQPASRKLLEDYQAQADRMAELERQTKPVEVDDKRRLQELHDKLVADEHFKKLTAAQVEYVDLMRKVNQALQEALADTEGATDT